MYKIEIHHVSLPGIIILLFFTLLNASCLSSGHGKKSYNYEKHKRELIVKEARKHIGNKYKYAGKNPGGFDCSGFTSYVFGSQNLSLGASSRSQSKQGKFRDVKDVKEGDLIFFGPPAKIDHVAIVTHKKKGKMFVIHSTTSQGVVEHDIYQIPYWKKRMKFARDVISP